MPWIDRLHDELDKNCHQNYQGDRNTMLAFYILNQPKLLRDAANTLYQRKWLSYPTIQDCKFFIFESLQQSKTADVFIEKYEVLIPKDVLDLYVFSKIPTDHRNQTLLENRKLFRNIPWSMKDIEWFANWLTPVNAVTGIPYLLKAIEKTGRCDNFATIIHQQQNTWIGTTLRAVEELTMLKIMPIASSNPQEYKGYAFSNIEQRVFSNLFLRSNILTQQTGENPLWNQEMLSYMANICSDIREWSIFANIFQEIHQRELMSQIQKLQHKSRNDTIDLVYHFPETSA